MFVDISLLSVGRETKTELEREQLWQPVCGGAHEDGLQDSQTETSQGPHARQQALQFYEKIFWTIQVQFSSYIFSTPDRNVVPSATCSLSWNVPVEICGGGTH